VSNKCQKTYPGGKGLGLNVLYESQTLDVDLLGGENCLAFESRLDDADFEANESLSVVAPGAESIQRHMPPAAFLVFGPGDPGRIPGGSGSENGG